jgi:hypothetical protein
MSDEFVKGLGVLMSAGLVWMVLSGWYATPSFSGAQLIGEVPSEPDVYGQMALLVREVSFWFAILGALFFWVVIPAVREAREAYGE